MSDCPFCGGTGVIECEFIGCTDERHVGECCACNGTGDRLDEETNDDDSHR